MDMETEEFEHYFRLCMGRIISSDEARQYLFAVNHHAEVEADDEDVVMVYHEIDGAHCYDVRLATDVTAEQGDEIIHGIQKIFPTDDFECESSMENIEEQQYIMKAGIQQLDSRY